MLGRPNPAPAPNRPLAFRPLCARITIPLTRAHRSPCLKINMIYQLFFVFSIMEALQYLQYFVVDDCGHWLNQLTTTVGAAGGRRGGISGDWLDCSIIGARLKVPGVHQNNDCPNSLGHLSPVQLPSSRSSILLCPKPRCLQAMAACHPSITPQKSYTRPTSQAARPLWPRIPKPSRPQTSAPSLLRRARVRSSAPPPRGLVPVAPRRTHSPNCACP
jgi:hypothetical protein